MMKITDTFVLVAPDCPGRTSVVPAVKEGAKPPVHAIQYELLADHPYRYTLEELIYEVHTRHKGIPPEELANSGTRIWDELFQKNHPCMRASMLPKKYGWGVHYDHDGKLALYGMESEEYRRFAQTAEGPLQLVYAMRSKR
jgi:hypothetical protein